MLKRGDRVQLVRREYVSGLPKGTAGTVLRDHDLGGEAVTVSFDGFTKGHWADGLLPATQPPSAWYVMLRDIEPVHAELIATLEELKNAIIENCETPVHETANRELQKDVDGSRPADESASHAERDVHQGTQRRGNDGPKRNR